MFRVCLGTLLATAVTAQVPPVQLQSGNVAPGQLEPQITFLSGPPTAAFGAPFTAGDFAAARSGPQAEVRATLAGGWPQQLPAAPSAQWIDTPGGSSTALYAIPFPITGALPSAVLTLQFAADDSLGDPVEPGVYVNERPLPETKAVGGYYYVETLQFDVGPLLLAGQNWLYLYLRNTGGAGGLLFHAEIQIDGGMVRRYGSGCAGSAGTPLLLAGAARTLPGDTAWLSLYSLPLGGPPVVLAFGLSNATSFGMPTPVDLGFLGFPGCAGWLEIAAAIVIVSSNGGARFGYVFPGPAFLGQSAFVQAFVFDPNHVRGASVTNAIELRAGY